MFGDYKKCLQEIFKKLCTASEKKNATAKYYVLLPAIIFHENYFILLQHLNRHSGGYRIHSKSVSTAKRIFNHIKDHRKISKRIIIICLY